jgi:hypothetical protein
MIETPSYFRLSERERETLLSQLGVTISDQRVLFHELVSNSLPDIGFNAFLNPRAGRFKNINGDLEKLFRRLQEARMGIITQKKNPQGEYEPHRLILTEEGSPRFWYYFLQNVFHKTLDVVSSSYLTLQAIKKRNIPLDEQVLQEASWSELGKNFLTKHEDSEIIFAFKTSDQQTLLVHSGDLGRWVSAAIAKVLYYTGSSDHLAALARAMDTTLTVLQTNLKNRDAGFWGQLAQVIVQKQGDFRADRRLRFEDNFYHAAEILLNYMRNQLQEAKEAKENEKARQQDMLQILLQVKNDEEVLVPVEDMQKMVELYKEKYGQEFSKFKEDFWTKYGQVQTKVGLPHLVFLQGHYVHRDNLCPQLKSAIAEVRPLMHLAFTKRMLAYLKGKKDPDYSFTNEVNLEKSLWQYLEREFDFLHELFRKPSILAEAVIHSGRLERQGATMEDLKPLLREFFDGDTMVLKRLINIFQLDILDVFQKAFRELPWWKKLFMYLGGRYASLNENFSAMSSFTRVKKLAVSNEQPMDQDGLKTYKNPLDDMTPRERAKERARQYAKRQQEERKKRQAEAKKRMYSKREQDTAWKNFGEGIKGKPED